MCSAASTSGSVTVASRRSTVRANAALYATSRSPVSLSICSIDDSAILSLPTVH